MWRLSPEVVVAEGIGFMRAAVAVRPESGHALMNLGNGYSFLGEYDQAIACYRKALELEKPYWACQSNLGESLARKGLFEEAIAAFEEAIRISPVHANDARAELSMVYSCCTDARLRDVGRAANLAEKALQLEPDISNSWTALGVARFREGKWSEARAALNRSLELKTARGGSFVWDEAINWFFLAMAYWHEGQKDQASDCYNRAIKEVDNGLAGRTDAEILSHIYAEADELMIADETTTAKGVDARGAAEASAELGRFRARQGSFRQAAADYAKAIGLEPDSEFIWFQGGSLLAHLGRREAFRKHCAAMLQQFGSTQDRGVAERTAKMMSCVPSDFSGMDPHQIVELADRALASGAPHEDIDIQWFHLAKGIADYRAGQFDSVLLSINKAKTPHWPVRTVLADLYMAMAQFHLGDREASVKTLDGAVAMMMTLPLPGRDDLGEHFHDYLFCQLARREAEALILDPTQEPTTNKEHNDSADDVNE
jgi:tetratricopeptide (TPR) repeat protein